ncbi:hypothetical protein N7492_005144 [Penicillium capsulatum]|uniref:Uncharacterized protein n=1 Tax=Penicillium capsulatum TaxID=69766 RepID=A0A9W9I992_9EURO|nr:hypothetical protein N7492_005144 [Penicillium capsulatum]KAJ6135751.1 hypothetical protein N7512_000911 [Penicillium capsulatum]
MKLGSWAISAALLAIATASPIADGSDKLAPSIAFRISEDRKSCVLEYKNIAKSKEALRSNAIATYNHEMGTCTNPNKDPTKPSVRAGAKSNDPKAEGLSTELFYKNATDPAKYRLFLHQPKAGELLIFPHGKPHVKGGRPTPIPHFGHEKPIGKDVKEVHFRLNSGAVLVKDEWKARSKV